jgi:DNA-binding MarR family transcriptional regulator
MSEHIHDDGALGKYFHFMLNIADDDLDPYQYRLLGHYRRVCGTHGKCTQSIREIAEICQMSRGMVTNTRDKLVAGGWITAQRVVKDGADQGYIVTLIDRMKDNIDRYVQTPKSREEVSTTWTGGCPPGETKNQHIAVRRKSKISSKQTRAVYGLAGLLKEQ